MQMAVCTRSMIETPLRAHRCSATILGSNDGLVAQSGHPPPSFRRVTTADGKGVGVRGFASTARDQSEQL